MRWTILKCDRCGAEAEQLSHNPGNGADGFQLWRIEIRVNHAGAPARDYDPARSTVGWCRKCCALFDGTGLAPKLASPAEKPAARLTLEDLIRELVQAEVAAATEAT